MNQASRFDGLLFDPFALFQNGFSASEVDIGRGEVLQALVIAPMVVMLDEGINLLPEITGQVVVFQQDAVLEGLVSSFDLALDLRAIQSPAREPHAFAFQPLSEIARDVAGSIVAEHTRLVNDMHLITT